MTEHADDIIRLLLWMVSGTGAALLALVSWIGLRLHRQVDELPDLVTRKLDGLHTEMVGDTRRLTQAVADIERDLRGDLCRLDRRLRRVERIQLVAHPDITPIDDPGYEQEPPRRRRDDIQ